MPARVASSQRQTAHLTAREWYSTLAVIPVIVITIFQSIGQYQEFNLFPVWILVSPGARIHPLRPALYCVGTGISFMYYWPTTLALVSRAAPAKVNATMLGIAYMSLFVSNNVIGAAIAAAGGLFVLIFGRRLGRVFSADTPRA